MTTKTLERLTVEIEIEGASAVEGRDGPQWELKVRYPWGKQSNWPDTTWIDRKGTEPPTGQHWGVVVEKKELKKDTDKGPRDPAKEYNWNWRIVGFGKDGAAPEYKPQERPATEQAKQQQAQPQQASAPVWEDNETRRQTSIERQVALKAAVDWTLGVKQSTEAAFTIEVAQDFYNWLSGAAQSTEVPTDPPEREMQ